MLQSNISKDGGFYHVNAYNCVADPIIQYSQFIYKTASILLNRVI